MTSLIPSRFATISALALLAAPATLPAEINFARFDAHPVEFEEIEPLLGIELDSKAFDGVTLAPGDDDLYIIHRRTSDNGETILRLDPEDLSSATVLTSDTLIAANLGAPFSSTLIFEAGFSTSPDRNTIYAAESFNGEMALFRLDAATTGTPASLILRSDAQLSGLQDFTTLPDGRIALVRGSSAGIGLINPNAPTPAYTEIVSLATLTTLLGGAGDPEVIAHDPTNNTLVVFVHDILKLVRVANYDTTPVVTDITPSAFGPIDLHDLVVDGEGTIYGFDEGAERIIIINGTAQFEIPVDDILELLEAGHLHGGSAASSTPGASLRGAAHGGEGGITLWRGLAVRRDGDEARLYVALDGNEEFAMGVLEFGPISSSAADWQLFE